MITKDIFNQDIILENKRVLLRPLQESDFDNLFPFSLNDLELWFYGLVTAPGQRNRYYINTKTIGAHQYLHVTYKDIHTILSPLEEINDFL